MDPTRLETILRCPLTHQRLSWVAPERIERLNTALAEGELRSLDGSRVQQPLRAAFESADGRYLYRVEDDIVFLLSALALTRQSAPSTASGRFALEKKSMMAFYDQIGWQQHDGDTFEDADLFEDLRPVARDYIHNCHLRLKQHLPARGRYLLDAACGPIQYPEYLTYSEQYEFRICVDLSIVALRRAREKLGERGIYLLCDITNLPLQDHTVQAFVSLHTLYHVPANEQLAGVTELYRVLSPGGSGAVVYSWGEHTWLLYPRKVLGRRARALLRTALSDRVVDRLKGLLKRGQKPVSRDTHVAPEPAVDSAEQSTAPPALYFSAHDFSWYRKELAPRFNARIAPWRSISVPLSKRYMHERYGGQRALALLFTLESRFPNFFGRHGQYPVFVLSK
jgi:SAM-dependent methyltransferase/uncharacterized protein YbaR (Trm112 family)